MGTKTPPSFTFWSRATNGITYVDLPEVGRTKIQFQDHLLEVEDKDLFKALVAQDYRGPPDEEGYKPPKPKWPKA